MMCLISRVWLSNHIHIGSYKTTRKTLTSSAQLLFTVLRALLTSLRACLAFVRLCNSTHKYNFLLIRSPALHDVDIMAEEAEESDPLTAAAGSRTCAIDE